MIPPPCLQADVDTDIAVGSAFTLYTGINGRLCYFIIMWNGLLFALSCLELKPNVLCAPLLGLLESPRHSCLLLAKLILAGSSVSIFQPNHIWIWVAKALYLSNICLEHANEQ